MKIKAAVKTAFSCGGGKRAWLKTTGMLVIILLTSAVNAVYAVVWGNLAQDLVSGAELKGIVSRVILILAGICLTAIAEQTYKGRLRIDIVQNYQQLFSNSLAHASMSSLKTLKRGDVYTRGSSNLSKAANIWTNDVWKILSSIFTILFSVCVIVFMNPLFCLLLFLVVGAAMLGQILISRPMQSCRAKVMQAAGGEAATAGDILDRLVTVRVENAEKWAFDRYKAALSGVQGQYLKQIVPIIFMMAGSFLCTTLPLLFSIFYPVFRHLDGRISLAACITMITLGINISTIMIALTQLISALQEDVAALDRVARVWQLSGESGQFSKTKVYRFRRNADEEPLLKVSHLNFGYTDDKPLIQDWNCTFERNKLYLFQGVNGAGKTTFMKLLNALYVPQSGTIEYNADADTAVDLEKIRSMTVMAEQEPVLFEGTLLENIRLGNAAITEERLREWYNGSEMRKVFSNISGGENAVICQEGANLSGGQKKCISICRALWSGAEVIILDEPTANLDREALQALCDEVGRVLRRCPEKTILAITHDDVLQKKFPEAYRVFVSDGKIGVKGGEEQV